MICDTEDWSNDAQNLVLITGINYIFKYIQIETVILNITKYFKILLLLLYFWSNKCRPGEQKMIL